jgi:serine/threonine-protein kinase
MHGSVTIANQAPPGGSAPRAIVNRILERYRVQECLAIGGSAEVWRAVDEQSGRHVAVKRPRPHLLSDPGTRERLVGEARAVAGLAHPGIIRVLDVDASEQPAIVLELVDGEPLSARLQRAGPLPPRVAAAIGRDLARALYHAHVRGVIHRDVKPGNVLLGPNGRPLLIDFGIARILADAEARRTETGMVMGTLSYMAPEQLTGEPLTPRSDLYGLGAVVHEMLTGRPPYPAQWPAALLEEQAGGPPRLEETEPALRSLVRACLQARATDRPRHAGIVADALDAWLAGDPGPALALGAPPAAPPDQAVTAAAVPARRPARRDRRHSHVGRRAALAALVGTLVLAGAAIAGLLGPGAADQAAALAPPSVPSPGSWAVSLAGAYAGSCTGDPAAAGATPAQLATMDEAMARRYVDALVAQCRAAVAGGGTQDAGGTGGHGNAGGNGHGHGHD